MSKLEESVDNPCPYSGAMKADEKGRVTIPPKKYTIGVAPLDVRNNTMKLAKVDKYSYKEIDGKVYRISESGIEYPPITKVQFEEIKRLHEEYFGKEKDDGMEH